MTQTSITTESVPTKSRYVKNTDNTKTLKCDKGKECNCTKLHVITEAEDIKEIELLEHILHSENQHLNTVTDLIINLAEHSQSKDSSLLKIIETIETLQQKQSKSLEKIEQNFDFLKNQQLDIISKVQTIVVNKVTDNSHLEVLNSQLENLYKEVKEVKKELSKLKDLTLS